MFVCAEWTVTCAATFCGTVSACPDRNSNTTENLDRVITRVTEVSDANARVGQCNRTMYAVCLQTTTTGEEIRMF